MTMNDLKLYPVLCSTGNWLETCRLKLTMNPEQFCKAIERSEDDYRDIIRGKVVLSEQCRENIYKLIVKAHWEELK